MKPRSNADKVRKTYPLAFCIKSRRCGGGSPLFVVYGSPLTSLWLGSGWSAAEAWRYAAGNLRNG